MKIRALALLYGPAIAAKAGDILEVDDAAGRAYIAVGAAVEISAPLVAPDPVPEAAALETPERAVLAAARPRRVITDEPREGDKAP
jgi:hypothetical protein